MMKLSKSAEKSKIRSEIKKLNINFDPEKKIKRDQIINDYLYAWIKSNNIGIIALYLALSDEVDLTSLILRLHKEKYQICAPRYNHLNNSYSFSLMNSLSNLKSAKYNINEPCGDIINTNDTDLMIIPGVAFSHEGIRLGRGKGYYDKLLKNYTGVRIGVSSNYQIMKKIPYDVWDEKVDWICNELDGMYNCNS